MNRIPSQKDIHRGQHQTTPVIKDRERPCQCTESDLYHKGLKWKWEICMFVSVPAQVCKQKENYLKTINCIGLLGLKYWLKKHRVLKNT